MTLYTCVKRSTIRSVVTGVVGASISFASCNALADFKEPGKIIAGSDMTFYPYEYMKDNTPKGFQVTDKPQFFAGVLFLAPYVCCFFLNSYTHVIICL